ncbi:MAG: hypothetical protein QXW48_03955 [Thermoplasmata archaeon]
MIYDVFKEFFDYFLNDLSGDFVINGGDLLGFINIDLYHLFIVVFSILVIVYLIVKPFYNLIRKVLGDNK